ncbi:MAG: S8 family serine peptidase [Bacteroidota bacterium]
MKDKKIGTTSRFYVKLKNEGDLDLLKETAKNTYTEIVSQNEYMPLWYTLKCTSRTPYSAMEAANFFYETDHFAATEPEFMVNISTDDTYFTKKVSGTSSIERSLMLTPNDNFYNDQWSLNNTGQYGGTKGIDIKAKDAWDITTGNSSVTVAIVDDGFERDHQDLDSNVSGNGYDAINETIPSAVVGSHGTAVAGIIGAEQGSNQGVSGVSPNAKLMSITATTLSSCIHGINWAWQNGADVINNSWSNTMPSNQLDNAITNALTLGRNGKGTIVIFSAGNDNTAVAYPANSNPDILAIGAMSPCGERKTPSSCDGGNWGSNFGNELDVIAPGVFIPTTDRQGVNGYDGSDYTTNFGGTSAAASHVAGVAALVLSVNSDLLVQEVNNIIEQSAQKVGGYTYEATAGRLNGTWHNEVGYGLVDAHAAVLMAESMKGLCFDNFIVSENIRIGDLYNQGANVSIKATNAIADNAIAAYHAGESVLLQPGFYVPEGASFRAVLIGCSSTHFPSNSRMLSSTESVVHNGNGANGQEEGVFEQETKELSSEELTEKDWVMYPNPAENTLSFRLQQGATYTINIYNSGGYEVSGLDYFTDQFGGIDISRFATGTYLVKVFNHETGEIKTEKLIIE